MCTCQASINLKHVFFTTGKYTNGRALSSYKFCRINAEKISIALQCALCTNKKISSHEIIGPCDLKNTTRLFQLHRNDFEGYWTPFMLCSKVSKICILKRSGFSRTVRHLTRRMNHEEASGDVQWKDHI